MIFSRPFRLHPLHLCSLVRRFSGLVRKIATRAARLVTVLTENPPARHTEFSSGTGGPCSFLPEPVVVEQPKFTRVEGSRHSYGNHLATILRGGQQTCRSHKCEGRTCARIIRAAAATKSALSRAGLPSGSSLTSSNPVRIPCPLASPRRFTAQHAMP